VSLQVYYANPLSYTLYALVVGQLGDNNTLMQTTGTDGSQVRPPVRPQVLGPCLTCINSKPNALSPATHAMHALCLIILLLLQPQTVSQFIESFLGYEWGFRWWCILIMAGYIIFFFLTCTLALKKLNWQSR
jgi:hypothetical protein